jgi:hypothetical protein
MKTTLVIDDHVLEKLREEAARQRRTISELVESALRLLFERKQEQIELPPLPSFDGNGTFVDISNRDSLYSAMEED